MCVSCFNYSLLLVTLGVTSVFLLSGQLIHSYDNANAELLNIEYSSYNNPLVTIFLITENTVSLQQFLQNTYVYYFYSIQTHKFCNTLIDTSFGLLYLHRTTKPENHHFLSHCVTNS